MIHNPSPEFSLFDEALISSTDGHCLFDSKGKLLSWSYSFGDFYPQIKDRFKPGYQYAQFMRDLMEHRVLQNLKPVEDVDGWVEEQVASIGRHPKFIHHLQDGRFMLIKHAHLSNGYNFFAASDITVSVTQREALEDNRRRFESFAQLAADWFWELDADLKYVYFSAHTTPLCGTPAEDLIGRSRISHLRDTVEQNSQVRDHDEALLSHQKLSVVLSLVGSDQSLTHVQVIAAPVFNRHGEFTGYLGCGKNVTLEYGLKQQLEFQAAHDELTGLVNRRAFANYLSVSLDTRTVREARDQDCSDLHRTLIYIDLDQFKLVNDNAGHQAGDQLLIDVTRIFGKVFSCSDDIVARLGGDEFAVLSASDEVEAKQKTEQFIKLVGEYRLSWDKRTFSIGASAGIVLIDSDSISDSDLLSKADMACYSAKMSGRNQAHLYSRHGVFVNNQNDEIGKLELINDSILHERLSIALQPIVPAKRVDDHTKFEVLLRLEDATRQAVPPGTVIPVAEKYDRMQHIDLWMIEHSLSAIKQFAGYGEQVALSVNLSGNTLSNESCLEQISRLVEHHQVEPKMLCFEVTETATIKRIEKACNFIEHLKRLGCEFSLDDFGSGLSSFSYLRSLPVDYLKIDGCFVANIHEDSSNKAIVKSFNTLAHDMKMKTVAEYVETDVIAELLTVLGIDYLQGFGVGRPGDLDEWLIYYAERQARTGT